MSPLPALLRLLALALVLATGGVLQTLAAVADVQVPCAEAAADAHADEAPCGDPCEDADGDCDGCSPTCATCLCCPGRVALTSVRPELRPLPRVREQVMAWTHEPVVGPRGSDIFQPPRA